MKNLLEMLTYRRPAGSKGEQAFIRRFIMPFKPEVFEQNLLITIDGGDGETLFSCHTDTVHKDDARQKVLHDIELNIAHKDDKEPLGGDNTAGVWLLLEMIKAKIPGAYMFHFGEERGCLGSKAMAKVHPDWLKSFKRAIAFDRRGNTSIITHQMGTRCCSDAFAEALAAQLGNGYQLDDTGLYTDTASYMELISECSNVSVGYNFEHRPEELVDVEHLLWLRDAVKLVDWDNLPTVRDCTKVEDKYNDSWWHKGPDEDASYSDDYYLSIAFEEIVDYTTAAEMVAQEPELAARILAAFTNDDLAVDQETPTLDDAIRAVARERREAEFLNQ